MLFGFPGEIVAVLPGSLTLYGAVPVEIFAFMTNLFRQGSKRRYGCRSGLTSLLEQSVNGDPVADLEIVAGPGNGNIRDAAHINDIRTPNAARAGCGHRACINDVVILRYCARGMGFDRKMIGVDDRSDNMAAVEDGPAGLRDTSDGDRVPRFQTVARQFREVCVALVNPVISAEGAALAILPGSLLLYSDSIPFVFMSIVT